MSNSLRLSDHYADVIMIEMASQITSLAIVYSIVYSDADQRNNQSSASLAFVRGSHRGPVNSPHKWPVTRKMFPFEDVIMMHICIKVSARQGSMQFCPTKISLGPHFMSPRGPKTLLYSKSQCHYNMKGLRFGLVGPISRIVWGPRGPRWLAETLMHQ